VLWKPSTPDQPGWESPWGRGRPGWHIECSAMSENTLGETFDIHGGGLDLIFPHHENEIAQSVCAHDGRGPQDFARYWMHNGMLTVGGAKMAKSDGNFITVRDALAQAPGEVIRLALLGTHYRDPLDWTEERLQQARQTLDRFYRTLLEDVVAPQHSALIPAQIVEAINDDLNAPLAITHMHQLVGDFYRTLDPKERGTLQSALKVSGQLLGLLGASPRDWLQGDWSNRGAHVEEAIAARTLARNERRFADADRIRDELAAEGVVLEDKPGGVTIWRQG
jgi:cysteinyl-tRNA synthetase